MSPPGTTPVAAITQTARQTFFAGTTRTKTKPTFLALLRQEQAKRALFPVGHLQKSELRQLAEEAGLPNAKRKDSQGICFIGKIRINDFLEQYIPQKPGKIVNTAGKVLGEHKGLFHYTIGQRRGINVPSNTDNEYYVVVAKRFAENELVVAFDHPETAGTLYSMESWVNNLSWVNRPITEKCEILARVRYRDASTPIVFTPDGNGGAHIAYKHMQRGIASGQIIAFYDGETLLGGGVYV